MSRRLRIGIATPGRFHVLDLARELHAQGHEVRFYSYVPRARAEAFGLPPECHVSLFPWALISILIEHRLGARLGRMLAGLAHLLLDCLTCWKLQPCDVFICMSGIYLAAPTRARTRYGARILVERGSRHVLSQREILAHIPGATLPSEGAVRRELAAYELADEVVIPSTHVLESFLALGFARERLFVNPYGVNLAMFQPSQALPDPEFDAIYVGGWSLRKGADLVEATMRQRRDLRLLHVGPVLDRAFPSGEPNLSHLEPVDQSRLVALYGQARFMVLASREEGLSVVLAQALACGLPVLCTTRTGGADLVGLIACPEAVIVVEPDSPTALVQGMTRALEVSRQWRGKDLLGDSGRRHLTWAAYGRRYGAHLEALVGASGPA